MTDAVIVSTARTPIGKAARGAFNITHGADMAGHAARHAVERAGIDPALIEDAIFGCGCGSLWSGAAEWRIGWAPVPVTWYCSWPAPDSR